MISLVFSAEAQLSLEGFLSTVKFTETRAYRAVLETLQQRNHVVILGGRGDGKTTLGLKALHKMREIHNSRPLIPQYPTLGFLPNLPEGQTFSILLDDMFGIYTVSEQIMSRPLVYHILSFLQKGNFLVISMRKAIYLQCKMQLPKELFSKDVVIDFTDPKFELLQEEKMSLLQQAFPNLDKDTEMNILSHETFSKHQIGFPQSVYFMKTADLSDIQNILDTPLDYIKHQLYLLFDRSRDQFLALLMAFLNQGRIKADDIVTLRSSIPNDIDDSSISSLRIKQALRYLETSYLHYTESGEYIISHELVIEGIAQMLWGEIKWQEYFIAFCPERFLTRLTNNKPGLSMEQNFKGGAKEFVVHQQHFSTLFERLHGLLDWKLPS